MMTPESKTFTPPPDAPPVDRELLLTIRQAALMGRQGLDLIIRYCEKRLQLERK